MYWSGLERPSNFVSKLDWSISPLSECSGTQPRVEIACSAEKLSKIHSRKTLPYNGSCEVKQARRAEPIIEIGELSRSAAGPFGTNGGARKRRSARAG